MVLVTEICEHVDISKKKSRVFRKVTRQFTNQTAVTKLLRKKILEKSMVTTKLSILNIHHSLLTDVVLLH